MNPIAKPIALLPVYGIPKFDITNVEVVWLLLSAWHIQKGSYNDKINFDGLNVVALFHAPGNMLTGPKWDAALYIDETASKEQTDSLTTIYSDQAGGFFAAASNLISKMLGVKSVPIEFGIDGKRFGCVSRICYNFK